MRTSLHIPAFILKVLFLAFEMAVILPMLDARSSQFLQSCTIHRGRCEYRVHLTGKCGTRNIPFTYNTVQNDYDERVNDIEKHLTVVRNEHTDRIKTLEAKLTNLIGGLPEAKPITLPPPETPDHSTTSKEDQHQHRHHHSKKHQSGIYGSHRPGKFKLDEDPSRKENALMNQLHETFTDLREDLRSTQERLEELNRQLVDSRTKLNQSQTALLDTTSKLLLTEQSLEEVRAERDELKAMLEATQAECNETKEELESSKKKAKTQNIALFKAREENARLRRELRELRLLLARTRLMLKEALRKYHELNVRHEALNVEMESKNEQLIECHRGKTAASCSFEDENICGFMQADNSTDYHDWVRLSGATPSGWTGPITDHTCGNDRGHYMYVEASTRGEGQTAHLVSPKYQGAGEQCVEFYYHMYGRDIGTLNVYTQVSDGAEFNPVWRAYGNQGNLWSRARIAIPVPVVRKGYKVIFSAILEYGYQGDIAIDDIRIFDGECYHIMTAEEMSEKFNVTFPIPTTEIPAP